MKIKLLIIFAVLCVIGNAQTWQWAKRAGAKSQDISNDITTDSIGSVYITGKFYSQQIILGGDTLNNVGSYDFFIAKYDSLGNILWAKMAGGSSDEYGTRITTDFNNNIYVIGTFSSPSIVFGTYTLTNTGVSDAFIVKYNSSGNVLWAKKIGGSNSDSGWDITTDKNGNVYVTGTYYGANITIGTTILTPMGWDDIFIAKYDSAGNVIWAKKAGGNNIDQALRIATDTIGHFYLTGRWRGSIVNFGTFNLTNSNSTTYLDYFLVKYDTSGNALWAKKGNGFNGDEKGVSLKVNPNGNRIYVAGDFQGSIMVIGTTTLINTQAPYDDIFITSYDSVGNNLWAKKIGGTNNDYIEDLELSGNYLYPVGYFTSTNIAFGSNLLNNAGTLDIYIAKIDTSGNSIWATNIANTNWEIAWGVANDRSGNIYVTGEFKSSNLIFGSNTIVNDSINYSDIYVAKLNPFVITKLYEENNSFAMSIFPNPSSSQITLQTNKIFDDATLTVYNSLGQQVKQIKNIFGKTTTINLDGLQSGLYFIHLTQNNKTFATDKLIIKKN